MKEGKINSANMIKETNANIQFLIFLMLKIVWVRNLAWDYFGVFNNFSDFWSRDCFGFCCKPYEFWGVLIFAPIRSSPSLESPSTLPGALNRLT